MKEFRENNKLIANFMGFDYIPWNDSEKRNSIITDITHGYWCVKGSRFHSVKMGNIKYDLTYHKDFNEIFKVISKIESLGFIVNIDGNFCNIYGPGKDRIPVFNELGEGNSKLEIFNNVIIKFINWYNGKNC